MAWRQEVGRHERLQPERVDLLNGWLPGIGIDEREREDRVGSFRDHGPAARLHNLGLSKTRREPVCRWDLCMDLHFRQVRGAAESEERVPEELVADVSKMLGEAAGVGLR